MLSQTDRDFEGVLLAIKNLSADQLEQLRREINKSAEAANPIKKDLLSLLLNGPVASKSELKAFAKNRKELKQWIKSRH